MGCEYKSEKLKFPPGGGLVHLFGFTIFIEHRSPLATMWFRITIFKDILVFLQKPVGLRVQLHLAGGEDFKRPQRVGGHNLLCLI